MNKIMMLLASNSTNSINATLLNAVGEKLTHQKLSYLAMSDFNLPIYSNEIESSTGIPAPILQAKNLFSESDAFIIASPEHNGTMPAAFKNFIDWLSRSTNQEETIFANKPVLLLSTSPGKRGGKTNLQHLTKIMTFWGAKIHNTYSIGNYYDNYNDGKFLPRHDQAITQLIKNFTKSLIKKEP